MNQDERWLSKYNEEKEFIVNNHRNPSRHCIEDHLALNWFKQQKKLLNAGALEGQRLMMFNEILGLGERYKRVNQYKLKFVF